MSDAIIQPTLHYAKADRAFAGKYKLRACFYLIYKYYLGY